jgi:HD-GYP domain-containing protein (c-di-GMP phosphodiesterase class II)
MKNLRGGKRFDPEIADALLSVSGQFHEIALMFSDSGWSKHMRTAFL